MKSVDMAWQVANDFGNIVQQSKMMATYLQMLRDGQATPDAIGPTVDMILKRHTELMKALGEDK